MFKFIHAADIHLDSPLRGLEQYGGALVQEIRDAARRVLANLVDLAIDQQVAFVVIAGDVCDGDWRDYNTGLYFVDQVRRLREADYPVVINFRQSRCCESNDPNGYDYWALGHIHIQEILFE